MEVEVLSRKKGIQGLAMTAPSGYSVAVNMEKCKACEKCVKACQYGAMKIVQVDGKRETQLLQRSVYGMRRLYNRVRK